MNSKIEWPILIYLSLLLACSTSPKHSQSTLEKTRYELKQTTVKTSPPTLPEERIIRKNGYSHLMVGPSLCWANTS